MLRELELCRLKMGMLRVGLTSLYECLMEGCEEDRARTVLLVLSDKTIGSRLKLKWRKFHLDFKKKVGFGCFF